MINIRQLTESDMQQAIELKVLCWTEELAGKAENTLSVREWKRLLSIIIIMHHPIIFIASLVRRLSNRSIRWMVGFW